MTACSSCSAYAIEHPFGYVCHILLVVVRVREYTRKEGSCICEGKECAC